MRIGVSLLNFRIGCMGGIETYFRKLIEYLPACAAESGDEIIFFSNRETQHLLNGCANVRVLDWSRYTTSFFRLAEVFYPFHAKKVERWIVDAELDVYFVPHQAIFPINVPVPTVITAHDVQHLYYPHYFSAIDRLFRASIWRRSLSLATGIISISHFTKGALIRECGVLPDKIKVVHHGCDKISTVDLTPSQRISSPFLFYPSASYPHKGHERLLKVFSIMKKNGSMPFKLVFCGMKTSYWKRLGKQIRALDIEEDVIHLGFLERAEVFRLYMACEAVVFPSEFEGFGLPVLEATQLGKKIICSKLDVFDELGIPPELQVDFSNPDELEIALGYNEQVTLISLQIWREVVRETLQMVKQFSIGMGCILVMAFF